MRLPKRLRSFFGRRAHGRRPSPASRPPRVEALEDRLVPTTTLFLDFGDRFPTAGLQMEVRELRDTLTGPDLADPFIGLNDGDTLTFAAFDPLVTFDYDGDGATNAQDATRLRADIIDLVERYYAPFDINVEVAAANNLTDVRNTLDRNAGDATGEFDAYVFVAGVTSSAVAIPSGLGGIASKVDIGNPNDNDDTAVVFANNLFALGEDTDASADTALALLAAHEAAHNFGLQHTVDGILMTRSDIIQRLALTEQRENLHMFTRFDLPLTGGGDQNSHDVLGNDPDIGLRAGASAYVTGTGAHDRITLTRLNATQATVTVEAFRTAAMAPNDLIDSFSDTIDTGNGIDVDAGAGDDHVVIDATLGAVVEVRGMAGTDRLTLLGNGVADGSYTPSGFAPTGRDEAVSFGGSLRGGTTNVFFSEFEPDSSVMVQDVAAFTFNTPLATDVVTVSSPAAGQTLVAGTSGGATLVPLTVSDVDDLIVDTSLFEFFSGADQVTVTGVGSGTRVTVRTGAFDDNVAVDLAGGFSLRDGSLAIDGGTGNNRLALGGVTGYTYQTYTPTGPTSGTISLGRPFDLVIAPPDITYSNIQGVDDTLRLSSATIGTRTFDPLMTVNGTAANDTLDVVNGPAVGGLATLQISGAGAFAPINFANKDAVTIRGLGGTDTMTLGPAIGSVTAPARLTTLTLDGGDQADAFTLRATPAGVAVVVEGGDADDTVVVGNGGVGFIRGAVTVNGGAQGNGGDALTIDDTGGFFARTYTMTASSVDIAVPAVSLNVSVGYGGVETLRLRGASTNDGFSVLGTAAGTATTIDTGLGADEIHVGDATSSLSNLLGNLTVTGSGAQTETLTVNDEAFASPTGNGRLYTLRGNTLTVNQGPGTNTLLDFSNVSSLTLRGSAFSDRYTLRALPAGVASFSIYGEGGVDTLQGTNAGSRFDVTAPDEGMLDGLVDFYSVGNLAGYHGPDVFRFADGGSLTGTIGAGNGADWLDYEGLSTGVSVDLAANRADWVMNGVRSIENVRGTAFDDVLLGDGFNNILVGGDGDDRLEGRDGLDMLIGGGGADTLRGGPGDDLLVGGRTSFDDDPLSPPALHPLQGIHDEWTSGRPYATRVANISGTGSGPRANDRFFVATGADATVFSDGAGDTLLGEDAVDWFFADVSPQDAHDHDPAIGEQLVPVP